ncbi:hypothetical protein ACLX1H_001098 [Fusarium chlamydosporum]
MDAVNTGMASLPQPHEHQEGLPDGSSSAAEPVSTTEPATQPRVVGESCVHRPIGECNETVQSVTCAARANAISSNLSQPRDKPASASFDMDRESTRLDLILSSYLLHYWFGNPTAYRDCHWWIAAAIRSAQCTGYHRSTSNSQMSPEQRSRWKRIWWCLYVRDRQIAISTGTPMVINDMDYDVEELVVEDLTEETMETAQYIIAQ